MDGFLDRFDVPKFDVPQVEVVVAFMLTGHDRCVATFYFVFLHVLFVSAAPLRSALQD